MLLCRGGSQTHPAALPPTLVKNGYGYFAVSFNLHFLVGATPCTPRVCDIRKAAEPPTAVRWSPAKDTTGLEGRRSYILYSNIAINPRWWQSRFPAGGQYRFSFRERKSGSGLPKGKPLVVPIG